MRYIKSFQNDAAIQAAVDNKTLGKPYVALNDQTGKIDWNGKDIDYSSMYLTIEALSGGTFYVRAANIGYSVNGADWETTTGETALALNQGDAVRFKGTAGGNSLFSGNTLDFNAYGNIESLEYGDDFIGKTSMKKASAFHGLFDSSQGLKSAEHLVLPATTLLTGCYSNMFSECSSLTTAPVLPATTIASNCYSLMFASCSNLTTAPVLNAPVIEKRCYMFMFKSCSNLNYIKCLASTIINESVFTPLTGWCDFVSETGTFVKKAGVEWPTGASGIPDGWTVIEE